MGKNRLQYKLLHKRSAQKKSVLASKSSKPQKVHDKKVLQRKQSSPINQETEETLRDLTPNKKGKRIKDGGIVKPKIFKSKRPNLGVNPFKSFIKCKLKVFF